MVRSDPSSSQALVTGGAGFIGSNLVRALVAEGRHVTVLDNLSSGYESNLYGCPGVRLQTGDVCDLDAVSRAMEGCAAIFHLAASVGNRRSLEDPVRDAQVNLIGTLNTLEASRQVGVDAVVVSSSAAVFGELKTIPIGEDHHAGRGRRA